MSKRQCLYSKSQRRNLEMLEGETRDGIGTNVDF